jgi:uncharacterized protein YndB with AHSA1/START domain
MTTTGSMTALDDTRGAVRVEDVYDTDIDDLWQACTTPQRLARWIAQVSGDLQEGGTVQAVFTSTWTGPMRIDVCDAPHHLLLTAEPGTAQETQMEAWLSVEPTAGADSQRTRLVVEERGILLAQLHFYGAGWQVHLEDLGRSIASDGVAHKGGWSADRPAPAWHDRWKELTPEYQKAALESPASA